MEHEDVLGLQHLAPAPAVHRCRCKGQLFGRCSILPKLKCAELLTNAYMHMFSGSASRLCTCIQAGRGVRHTLVHRANCVPGAARFREQPARSSQRLQTRRTAGHSPQLQGYCPRRTLMSECESRCPRSRACFSLGVNETPRE